MKSILIIGGTVFLGRHLVAAAKSAGLEITTFNRGTHALPEQSGLEHIKGDREKDLLLLKGRHWDVVIDTCGMEPASVQKSVDALYGSVDTYVFISSVSAYDNFRQEGINEHAPAKLRKAEEEQDYGSRKAWCEKIVSDKFGKQAYNIRPGLIVGACDQTDRFTYWPRRIARGGRVLAPGRPDRAIQFIDVRDLSEWILRIVDAGLSGTYNATGPGYVLQMGHFLQQCKEVTQSNAEFFWLEDAKILEQGISPWIEMPLWIPESDLEYIGFEKIDCSKAQNRGLSYRTLFETIEYTWNWDLSRSEPLKAGLDYEKEQIILAQCRP